ncbi:cupredoxin domain-containing protein [Balneicella halophila]|uniref:hypothetical protein n=1 Tax=Balneicella halophila TaxID=1537566 RepID=UPI0021CEE81A|nr:hypothetical protein [Balneicella halophila]
MHPKEKTLEYDKELVVVLSDWTHEKPMNVLRNLKLANEWYQVKKGSSVPLSAVISRGALGAQLKMWRDRMEGADVADIYYPAFLSNGKDIASYPNFKAGEKVRMRFINASSSSYYWLDFGGGNPMIVASDGIQVKPVSKNRIFFAIAETYDVIVTMPDGTLEITATVQDGSGHTSVRLGEGKLIPAIVTGRPDKIAMMEQMAEMDIKMGAPSIVSNPKKKTPQYLNDKYGMDMDMDMEGMDNMNHEESKMKDMKHSSHNNSNHQQHENNTDNSSFDYDTRKTYFNYVFLEAKEITTFPKEAKVNEMLLTLTRNMNRYMEFKWTSYI